MPDAASAPPSPPPSAPERATAAERAVVSRFGGRLLGLPLTHLARVDAAGAQRARVVGLRGPWHYWWQAHYLDALVDAGLRRLAVGDADGARARARRGHRLLRSVRLRNRGRLTNDFYDDMAWLALASGRLAGLDAELGRARPRRALRTAERVLTARLVSAATDDLGGGLFWSTARDFKNAPATGPAALHAARLGDVDAARRHVDWLWQRLRDPATGLVRDGIRVSAAGERLVPDVWTYNQGTVLGALVTLGDDESLARAASLVDAVATHLTTSAGAEGGRVLVGHGGGDGGLFTGILARYLALAATTEGLATDARRVAARLVTATADALWRGRSDDGDTPCFSPDPARPAADVLAGPSLELSPQLQAWTVLEAAATLRCDAGQVDTLFEAAGGAAGMDRLAHAWHERVLADPVVSHAFSHGFRDDHTPRLAAYWTEALGGPAAYSQAYGDETSVVRMHSGNGPHDEMDRRAVACFDDAMTDVGLTDERLRTALHDYFAWATTETMGRYHHSPDDVPDGLAIPRWSWDGLQAP